MISEAQANVPVLNVHLTAVSGNSKTGAIPVTYRPMVTCEPACPFLPADDAHPWRMGGCYGTGRIFGMARKYAATHTVGDLRATLQRVRPGARYLRDRVVGDILTPDQRIDHGYLGAIALVARDAGLIPFGYTHSWRRFTRDDVARVASTGYVMNGSCETLDDVRHVVDLGMPAVITSDTVEEGATVTGSDGRTVRVVTCPAQTRDDTTCATCGLCAKGARAAVVRFRTHGTARRRAAQAVAGRNDGPQDVAL